MLDYINKRVEMRANLPSDYVDDEVEIIKVKLEKIIEEIENEEAGLDAKTEGGFAQYKAYSWVLQLLRGKQYQSFKQYQS
jgi:hypothetical protein